MWMLCYSFTFTSLGCCFLIFSLINSGLSLALNAEHAANPVVQVITRHSQGFLLSKDYSKWNHIRSDIIKDILSLREQTSLLNNPVISEQQFPSLLNVTSSFFMVWITTGLALHHQSASKANGTNVTLWPDGEGVGRKLCIFRQLQESFRKAQLPPQLKTFVLIWKFSHTANKQQFSEQVTSWHFCNNVR